MVHGSMVILKGIRRNNLYDLKCRVVTENLTASEQLNDSIRLWQIRLGHVGKEYLHALAKQGLLKGEDMQVGLL